MTALYQIAKEYTQLAALDDDDMPLEAIQDTLEAIGGEFDDKAVSVIKYSKGIEGDLEIIDMEIARLRDIKLRKQNHISRLRDYLKNNMIATGISKITCPFFSITLGKPTTKADIVNEEDLPEEYVDISVVTKPDKRKILADLKKGVDIPGAQLINSEPRLLIK